MSEKQNVLTTHAKIKIIKMWVELEKNSTRVNSRQIGPWMIRSELMQKQR